MKVALKIHLDFDLNPSIHLFLYTKALRGVGAHQQPGAARPIIHLVDYGIEIEPSFIWGGL